MTKKQLKRLAKEIAECERIIQINDDPYIVNEAKDRITHLTETANLDMDDMIQLDEIIQSLLSEKI